MPNGAYFYCVSFWLKTKQVNIIYLCDLIEGVGAGEK